MKRKGPHFACAAGVLLGWPCTHHTRAVVGVWWGGYGRGCGRGDGQPLESGFACMQASLEQSRHSVRAAGTVTGTARQAASMRHKPKGCAGSRREVCGVHTLRGASVVSTDAPPGACFLYGHRRESRTRARTRGQPLHSDSRICLRQVAPRDQPCTRTRAPARSSRRPATIAPPGGWRWTSNRSSVACTHTPLKFPLNEPRLPPHPPGESRTLRAQAASSLRTAAPQQHTQRAWSRCARLAR